MAIRSKPKGPGRPAKTWDKAGRALDVAHLMIVDKKPRDFAIAKVAMDHDLSFWMIEADYKRYGNIARKGARGAANAPEWLQIFQDFKQLLRTFENPAGTIFTDEDVDEILGLLPGNMIQAYVDRIRAGPLRRNIEFLNEVVSPIEIEWVASPTE